ncbi:MAG: hypothetical protein ACJ06V_10195 [Verrucomicrobiota bacterium]
MIIGAMFDGVVLLLWQFAVNVLASALLMFVLLAANPSTLGSRLALVLCFAVFAVLTELIPNWNWGGIQFGLHRQTDWRADRRLGAGRPGLGQGYGQVRGLLRQRWC